MELHGFEVLFGQIGPGTLLAILIGLTQFFKENFGLSGRWAKTLTLVLGTGLGTIYTVLIAPEVSMLGVFIGVMYGVLLSLTAMGLYKVGMGVAERAANGKS